MYATVYFWFMTSTNRLITVLCTAFLLPGCQNQVNHPESRFLISSSKIIAFEFSKAASLSFYDSIESQKASFTIDVNAAETDNGDSLFFAPFKNKTFAPIAFNKEAVRMAFEVTDQQNSWVQVITNKQTKETKWIRPTEDFIILSWHEFLTDLASIQSQANRCRVRRTPDVSAPLLKNCEHLSCLKAVSANEDWLVVIAGFSECQYMEQPSVKGAIRWTNDRNELLIDFNY